MAIITLPTSLEGIEATAEFANLPIGQYEADVEKLELKEGPKGTYMNLQFNIVEPPEFAGRKMFDSISFSTESGPRHKSFRLAGNLDGDVSQVDTDDYPGLRVAFITKQENKKAKDESGAYVLVMDDEGNPKKKDVIARYVFK